MFKQVRIQRRWFYSILHFLTKLWNNWLVLERHFTLFGLLVGQTASNIFLLQQTSHSQPKRVNKMQGLRRMSTDAELLQFVNLWSKLQYIQLTTTEDTIIWRFPTSRKYSASSAYKIQRKVSYPDQKWDQIWNVKVEPECSFFYFFRDRA